MSPLSDFVSASGQTIYAEIALVIFFILFVGICVWVAVRGEASWDRVRRLPLEEDDEPSGRSRGSAAEGSEDR